MSELVGARVRIAAGPCAGAIGVVTEVKRAPGNPKVIVGEFRVEFEPPVYLPTAGRLNAVWRRATDLEVVSK